MRVAVVLVCACALGCVRDHGVIYDGATWKLLQTVAVAPARSGHVAFYDGLLGQVVVFGGTDGSVTLSDTWAHRFNAATSAQEICADTDGDGDKLVGCADPDCWARCAPLRTPRASCDPAAPHCGDGTCSPVEDYVICPADCQRP